MDEGASGANQEPVTDACGRCGELLLVLLTFCPGCGLLLPLCPSCITAHVAELADQSGRTLGD